MSVGHGWGGVLPFFFFFFCHKDRWELLGKLLIHMCSQQTFLLEMVEKHKSTAGYGVERIFLVLALFG